jgi:small-conductance mechanosensitive channel
MTEEAHNTAENGVTAVETGAVQQSAESAESAAESSHNILGLGLDIDFHSYIPDWAEPAWNLLVQFPLLAFVVLATVGYLIGRGLQVAIRGGVDKLISATHPDFDERLIKYLTMPLAQIVLALFLMIGTLTLGLSDPAEKGLIRIIMSVLIFFWARAWFRATHFILDALSRHETHGRVFHVRTLPLYRMGIKLFLLAFFVWLFMAVWGINATAWLASAGIIGIVVGFAARDTLANLISGVSIVADAPYKIGDYVVIDSGERGIVMNLGLRSTRILTRDDVEVSIPNAVIGNAKIVNESGGPWEKHRVRVPIGVSYSSDMDKVVEVLKQIAADSELIVENPAPRVRLRGFGDNSIDMDFMGWIERPQDRGRTVHLLLMEVIRRFREEGIEIPFPQRDLHLKDGLAATQELVTEPGDSRPASDDEPGKQNGKES